MCAQSRIAQRAVATPTDTVAVLPDPSADVAGRLAGNSPSFRLCGVKNRRLARDLAAEHVIDSAEEFRSLPSCCVHRSNRSGIGVKSGVSLAIGGALRLRGPGVLVHADEPGTFDIEYVNRKCASRCCPRRDYRVPSAMRSEGTDESSTQTIHRRGQCS